MRVTHKVGERTFADFAGSTVPIWDEALEHVVANAQIFVATLGVSGFVYTEALASPELIHWTAGLDHAFAYEGGPALVVPDNLESVVIKTHRYESRVHATYHEMATHYATAILPARVRQPRDKAKTEGRRPCAARESLNPRAAAQSPLHVTRRRERRD